MSVELDKEYIKNIIQNILNNNHTVSQKKLIKQFPERLNIACPICGDSTKSDGIYKKRGNLYFKNLRYICFNDKSCNCSFSTLLKRFNINIDLEKKLELYNYIDSNVVYRSTDNYNVIDNLDHLLDLEDFIKFLNRSPEYRLTHIKKIEKGSLIYNYIVNKRKIKELPDSLYEGIYSYTDKWKDPVVINFNKSYDNKIIGMQIRNLKEGDTTNRFEQRFYKIYDFSQLWDIYNEEPLDELEKIPYNKLSHFYNIFNVDFDRTITIFEGFFDSIFFPNSIGAIGKNTDFNFILNDTDIDVQFFFDNDKDGFEKSREFLQKGYKVFLWNKFIEDIANKKKDKKEAINYMRKIKDLNKLAIESKKNPYEFFHLQKYFSKDIFDIYYLNY